ncbi:glycosyl hydrolase family 28 protein [uncultured Chitinophaga sp.]|uniref:glycosyl hydrolase family 28 protein n=1 Tax=uncultured Chitinophaga sp. TaxID=339340 RepID=UPI0025E91892|nr:glycosyl hydrolase family 28 protein [uncultured Chitinophaga sp.]
MRYELKRVPVNGLCRRSLLFLFGQMNINHCYGMLAVLLVFSATVNAQQLVTYPAPQEVIYNMHNDDFTVRVRTLGGEWQDLFEYKVKVDMDRVQESSMVYFDMEGPVEVMVRKNNEDVRSVSIRPLPFDIKPEVQGNEVRFTLQQPRKLSVEFNGDKLHNLHLFASPVEKERPSPSDSNVIYFGPGLHLPKDTFRKTFVIPSGKTVYVHGSAILRGQLSCEKVKNVRILGRGIIDQAQEGVLVSHSEGVEINGLHFINPKHYTIHGGASNHLTIRNITSFSCQGWSDGIDLMSCSNVVIDDVFMRNSDDCIAIYGHRWKFFGSARNYQVTNAILWADIAHPVNIGLHGNTNHVGDTVENMTFKNIHILEHDEDDPDYQGCMAITCGDLNLVRNIRFENVWVDDFQEGQLFNIRVVYNPKYNTGPGRGVRDIYFRNIYYNGSNSTSPLITGLDKDHIISGVTFDNLVINGKPVKSAPDANIRIGGFTEKIVFKN